MTDQVTGSATVARVPEPRGISDQDAQAIVDALDALEEAKVVVEKAVAKALINGASAPAIQDATGLSPNTIYKYGSKHGWPTKENRANFNASKYPKRPGRQR